MKLGRNQLIACVAYGSTFIASIPICAFMQNEAAGQWLDWAVVFVPTAVGSLIAISGVIKAVAIVKNGKQPDK